MRVLSLAILLATADAHAGRSQFGWLGATETLEPRALELQIQLTEHNDLGSTRIRETTLGLAGALGVTDRLELVFPFETSWMSAVGLEDEFALRRYGAGLRYRFTDRASSVSPVLRFTLERDVLRRDVNHGELDATISYRRGRMLAAAELGLAADASRGGLFLLVRPGAGINVEVARDLRLGAELHAELDRESGGTSWLVAGPSLSWTYSRFWIAATYAIGFSNISSAPRLVWAAAF
jgi:hypothetical protein